MYEIVEPVLEENEVFDSSLLKETINSLIASGKRNFAIDMSPLDYIYSDTINMLMALNRRVLDVTGRLSLMAPQPEVMQILKRAGIHNILRIFDTESELIRSSEDIILQTSSIKLSDVNAALRQAPPQSEFDQLRSEIGSVFGGDDSDGHHAMQEPPIQQQQSRPTPAAHHGHEDEFDQMFQQFEHHGASQQKPVGYTAPPQVSPQTSQFQPPRQFAQPSGPQSIPMRPSAPVTPRQPVEPPKFQQDFSAARSETQKFPTAPVYEDAPQVQVPPPRKPISMGDDDLFDASPKSKPGKKSNRHDDFDSFEDDSHDEFKKKSAAPVLVIVILAIVLLGGGLAAYFMLGKKEAEPVATAPATPTVVPVAPPQVPVDVPPAPTAEVEAPAPVVEAPVPPAPEKEIVESKPEVAPPPVRKAVPRKEVRRAVAAPAPKPELQQKQPEVKNQIVFSSSPSGASILINGQNIGMTPFTWTKPFFGSVNVQITKPGYALARKSFEFTGGSMNEFYSLEREVVEPPPPVVERPVTRQVEREPVQAAVAPPARKSPPPPPSEDEDLFDDIGEEDDNFSLDEGDAPTPPPKPPVATARPTPTATTPSSMASRTTASSSMGGEALIFIASIPPVADVYIGDKLVGKTNVSELKLPAGSQTLRFVKGGKEISKEIMLKVGKNPSQMVRIP